MEEVQIEAPAKINIGLDVVGKREDGYHLVRMIMQTVALSDTIVVKRETQGVSMQCIGEGEAKTLETDDRNLCIRAANLMKKNHALSNGYTISLTKRIPIQAGMAGGSTDAAAVMLAINRLENLKLSEDTLMKEAVAIGADVPYCILKKTALAEGIGEKLTPLFPMPKCPVLIVKPQMGVSTQGVYQKLDGMSNLQHPPMDALLQNFQSPIETDEKKRLLAISESMGNILCEVTEREYPKIAEIRNVMQQQGACRAMMTGSGPTVFGLFTDIEKMQACQEYLKNTSVCANIIATEILNV